MVRMPQHMMHMERIMLFLLLPAVMRTVTVNSFFPIK